MFAGANPKSASSTRTSEHEDIRRNSGHFNSNSHSSSLELKPNTTHLRLMASDRDPLQRDIHKTQVDRETAYRRLAMSGDTVVTSSLSSLNKNQGVSVSDRSLNGGRDFDHQRPQQDHLHFQRQQQDQMSKSGAVAREDFGLSKPKVKSDEHKHDALKLKKPYTELIADKHRLEQEGSRLQKFTEDYCKETSELRRQQQALSDSGSGDTAHRLHQTAVRKCEALKEEYDALHKRYADLVASHSAAVSKLELAQEELVRLRKNFDECVQERNVAIRERNGLQQQCTAAIRQWDNALRERNEAREQLSKVQQQRDEAMKEINQAMAVRIKATKDLARLTEERNAAVQEYSLIMSERDSVHKEIERLQEELAEAQKKVKAMEADKKSAREELESLRREIASALQDRDRALKECNELREKYGDFVTGRDDGQRDQSRDYDHRWEWQDYENRHEGERTTSWDSSNQDNQSKTHAQRLDDLDQANMEIEALRRQVERLHSDLVEAQQEADVCKRRRDWAFSERDKIVLERESIRTLCDKLRRERDRAVSDLAEALRDSDDIKRQKNEASKELKELKEKFESQMEKECRMKQLNSVGGNNYSRDSAIDTDMQEWEMEILEVTMRNSSSDDDWGFDLVGGKDDPVHAHDTAIYVNNVTKGGLADGKLKSNDCVLKINGIDLTNVERRVAEDAKRSSKGVLTLVVRRRRVTSSRGVQTVALNLTGSQEHGLAFEHGIYVSHILPGSVAAREGNLAVGDRLLMVNGKSLEGVQSISEVIRTIDSCGPHLVFQMAKCNPCPSSPPSSASSGHNLIERVNGEKVSASRTNSGTAPSSPAKDSEASSWSDKETKLTSSGVQTEDIHLVSSAAEKHSFLPTSVIRGKSSSSKSDRVFSQSSQPTLLDRAYHRIFGDRRHSKEKKPQCVPEVPPLYANDEDDPIAELDSVLNDHSKPTNFAKSGSKSDRRKKDRERNGGTWPKCRGPPLHFAEIGTVTTLHTHKKKERKSLAAFTKQLSSYDFKGQACMSDQSPNAHFVACGLDQCSEKANEAGERVSSTYLDFQESPQSPEHSVPGDMQMRGSASMSSSSSSARTSSVVSSYSSPPSGSPHKSARGSQSSERLDAVSSLHFSGNTSPDTSLDYSVVSAHRDKDVLEFYKNRSKQRPRSAHYIFSDSECLSPIEPLPVPPQFGKPFASLPLDRASYGHNEPLSLSPPLSERSHTPRSSEHMYHAAVPTTLSSRVSLLRSGVAFYTIGSGQRGITHSHLHHPHNLGTGCGVTAGSVPPSARYSSPPGLSVYTSRSGDSLLSGSTAESASGPETRLYHSRLDGRPFSAKDGSGGRYSVTPSPSPSQYSYFGPSPSQSMDLVHFHPISHPSKRLVPAHIHSGYRSDDPYGPSSFDGLSTFPKGKQRIRIPSNPSVTSKSSAGKMSTSSIEKASSVSERGSPMPAFTVEWLGSSGSHTLNCDMRGRKPNPGDLRCICIEKSSEPLGIQISCGNNGGIFVSSVSENSLAAQAGLQVGDQLLEVCGINMRSATYILAANVLRQCGDSITMLVQYSPDKYQESIAESSSSDDPSPTHTPAPSPKTPLNHTNPTSPIDLSGEDAPSSATSTLTRQKAAAKNSASVGEKSSSLKSNSAEPRVVVLKKTTSNLGISLLGGNAVGIFVHSVQDDSPVSGASGLKPGDQILEYNGVDLRNATAEEAAYELAKPADSVTVLAQYNMEKYMKIQDQPGDSFYIRALFDRPSIDGSLAFRKDDVLYVDNTMFNGVPGLWRAWLVDQEGEKVKCGVIPSKYKVEEELLMRRSLGEGENGECTRRGSTSARRSFFRRRRHHRSSSRDSKELASFSDVSINSCSDSGTIGEELVPPTYLRVERLDYLNLRPVILVGPLMEAVLEKLEQDFPHMFQRCFPELLRGSQQLMEHGLQDLRFIDLRRKGSHVECISATAIKEICDKNLHALLDVSLSAVERLHRCQIYPIVIFIKFKSIKQIREVKDSRYLTEKVTTKAAKEMYEHALKIESEYRHFINVVIPGSNLAYMCTQVKTCVEEEQRKTLWVPSGTI